MSLKLRTTNVADDIKPTTGIVTRTSYAAWWLKNPPKTWTQKQLQYQRHKRQQQQQQGQQQKRKQSFSQDMGDLFRNVALHGYSKLLDPELTVFEKLIWLSLHVTSMVTLCIVLSYTWEQFAAQYFVINLHDPLYPVENVPFPAVSICSNNRISRQAAMEYAKELQAKDPLKRELQYFVNNIKNFSNLYYRYIMVTEMGDEYIAYNQNKYSEFQKFLERYGVSDNNTLYNTRQIMRKLTPNCSDFVMQCYLAGVEIECFNPSAFEESHTTYGECCTFNNRNSYQSRSSQNRYVSSEFGLAVILNTSSADDFSSILNIDSYTVIIHNSDDYPDVSSGASQEVFATSGEESYVSIKARLIDTDYKLHSYEPETRKCYFNDEAPSPDLLVRDSYSFSNCITQCRIRSIMALCQCIPFYMPLELIDTIQELRYCTLDDINCLMRYGYKWRNVLTQRQSLPELVREREESLYCPACLPSCDDVQYQVSLMSLPLERFRTTASYKRLENNGTDLEHISVLRVYFGNPHSVYYRRVIGNAWFEVLSTIGNILSIFLGFSMLAVFEILYFFVKHLIIAGKKFINQNNTRDKQKRQIQKDQFDNKLFICP